MSGASTVPELVFDTGPLSHFTIAGWLGPLRAITKEHVVVIPEAVEDELRQGTPQRPQLQQVLDAPWIQRRRLESALELASFTDFASRLVGVRGRNVGESEVLAYAQAHGAVAVIDDRVACAAGREAGVEIRPTLALLCEAVRTGMLTSASVSELADHLIESSYRLPFGPGQFVTWARERGLLP